MNDHLKLRIGEALGDAWCMDNEEDRAAATAAVLSVIEELTMSKVLATVWVGDAIVDASAANGSGQPVRLAQRIYSNGDVRLVYSTNDGVTWRCGCEVALAGTNDAWWNEFGEVVMPRRVQRKLRRLGFKETVARAKALAWQRVVAG